MRRGLRHFILVSMLALVTVQGAGAVAGDVFTASGTTPSVVKTSTNKSFTITITNGATSPEAATQATIAIPSGFTSVANISAKTGAGGSCTVAATWTSSVSGSTIQLSAGTPATHALCPGRTLTVTFTATSPSADATKTWTTTLSSTDAFVLQGSQPTTVVDGTPPNTSITSQPADPTNQTTASFSFTSTEDGSTFTCKLDNGSTSSCTSPKSYSSLAGGPHTVTITATDAAGNVDPTPATYTWHVDRTAPNTSITAEPADPTNQADASFSFTSTETGSTFTCNLDGSSSSCTSPTSYPGLADGLHTFTVDATDAAGNTDATPATYTWRVDTTPPPAPSIDSGPADPTSSASASFAFSDAEAGVAFRCKLDDGSFANCTSPKNYNDLADGSHTFTVEARDGAGNTQTSSYTWTVDRVAPPAPTIDSAPADPSNSASPAFTFSDTEAGTTFRCKVDDGSFASCTSPASYDNLGEGQHTFTVQARDGAGNLSAGTSFSWTIDLTPPAAPSIDSAPADPSASAAAEFAFSDSENDVAFWCSFDGADFAACSSPASYNDLADGSHTFIVEALDAAGNGSETSFTWTVDKQAPLAPKILSGPAKLTNARTASFAFSDGEDQVSFRCRLDGAAFAGCTTPKSYAALGAGAHTFDVVARDEVGNESTIVSYTWTIDLTPPDTTVLSGPSDPDTATTATFSFSATKTGSTFQCKLDTGAFAACSSPKTYTALAPIRHTFQVRAVDKAGNVDATPAARSWTVVRYQAPDVTPPGPAQDATPKVGYGALTIFWAAPSDPDFDHFVLRRATGNRPETTVYKGAGTTYHERKFRNDVSYRFRIITFDHAGNASRGVTITIKPSALLASPRAGAVMKKPPLLRWFRVARASYYNVQLYRSGRKVLSIWPGKTHLKLQHRWTYNGHTEAFGPGRYRWFVWPGYGPKARGNYGALIGQSTFVVR